MLHRIFGIQFQFQFISATFFSIISIHVINKGNKLNVHIYMQNNISDNINVTIFQLHIMNIFLEKA